MTVQEQQRNPNTQVRVHLTVSYSNGQRKPVDVPNLTVGDLLPYFPDGWDGTSDNCQVTTNAMFNASIDVLKQQLADEKISIATFTDSVQALNTSYMAASAVNKDVSNQPFPIHLACALLRYLQNEGIANQNGEDSNNKLNLQAKDINISWNPSPTSHEVGNWYVNQSAVFG